MKQQLYLYLFILSSLVAAFTYMYFTKELSFEKNNNKKEIKYLNDSITRITNDLIDANHFSLENNQFIKDLFTDLDLSNLEPKIKESLLAYNEDAKGNIYIGQEKIGDKKFIINKIKILNHRWIIADFNDGKNKGEVLIKYFVDNNKKITFQIIESIIYQKH